MNDQAGLRPAAVARVSLCIVSQDIAAAGCHAGSSNTLEPPSRSEAGGSGALSHAVRRTACAPQTISCPRPQSRCSSARLIQSASSVQAAPDSR
jgi:hypothetical protein